jgi:hypothetical protein
VGCDPSAGFAVEGWLNGVVEARRKVLVPFERGLLQILVLTGYGEQPDVRMPLCRVRCRNDLVLCGFGWEKFLSIRHAIRGARVSVEGKKVENSQAGKWGEMDRPDGGGAHHSPLPAPREESLRPLPLESRFWPAAAEAKLDVN